MQNGTANTMLKMVCVFSEDKNDCQKQRKKHSHLPKREFKTKTNDRVASKLPMGL